MQRKSRTGKRRGGNRQYLIQRTIDDRGSTRLRPDIPTSRFTTLEGLLDALETIKKENPVSFQILRIVNIEGEDRGVLLYGKKESNYIEVIIPKLERSISQGQTNIEQFIQSLNSL